MTVLSTSPNLKPSPITSLYLLTNATITFYSGNWLDLERILFRNSNFIYHKPLPGSQKSRNLSRMTPGNQNLSLGRRNGQNPSDRSIEMPMGAHETATEDKCGSSWAYLSSYIYHQPLVDAQNYRKTARNDDPREPKPCPCTITPRPNLGPSAKNLLNSSAKVNI